MNFPQLYTISSYSLLQSTIQIKKYVAAAKEKGYRVLGICDRNVLTGVVEFAQACQAFDVRPIYGLHLDYYSPKQDREYQLLLYAKNYAGYQRLMQLSSAKMIHQKVTLDQFGPLTDLIGILPEENELVELFQVDPAKACGQAKEMRRFFGEDGLFWGVSPTFLPINGAAEWFSQQTIFPAAIYPVKALAPEELTAVNVMDHIKNGTQIAGLQDLLGDEDCFLKPERDVTALFFSHYQEALLNTQQIAQQCQVDLPLHQRLLPHYPLKTGDAESFLRTLCLEKLPQRVDASDPRYLERLNYELSVIHHMGFDDYFLIVWDVMDFAHRQKYVMGAGRGSAAGSLVAYLLEITNVDPIEYDLLFERFLNPERYTMPDIDLDIPDNHRGDILQYVHQKYGTERMAQIATFGTMKAKQALRDVARVFGLSQSEANRWSNTIGMENKKPMTLARAYEKSARLREMVAASDKNRHLYQTALVLEGLPRHTSTHAAGVVISDQELIHLIPLQEGSDGILLTQFTMGDVEAVGLLKMDFLGLRNLTTIDDALKGIKKVTGEVLDINQIPLDDGATYQLFKKGDTNGIFQFESSGIKNLLRRLGPDNMEEVAAASGLYRPGPSVNIDSFVARKKGQEPVVYPDPSLAPILKNTYGIMLYQEQIMQVASQMAGFTLGQADILRRAISKKKRNVLDEQRRNFINGALQKGYSQEKAGEIYDLIERFADYGFNRSHALAYSFVSYQLAYLKVHYPGPFFNALLSSVLGRPEKTKEYINEAKQRGIEILPPSINHSWTNFSLESITSIRFGLGAIKGLPRNFIYDVLQERKNGGRFTSLNNFLLRLDPKWLKIEVIEPLVEVGAFDEVEKERRRSVSELASKIQNVEFSGGSMDLLDLMELKVEDIREYDLTERLEIEEKYLGMYLSGHPAEKYRQLQRGKSVQLLADVLPNQRVRLLLYVKDIREIRTKKGEQMAFITGNDPTSEISVTVFPELYRRIRQSFGVNDVIYVEGKAEVSNYDGELQIVSQQIMTAEAAEQQLNQERCYLKITGEREQDGTLNRLSQLLADFPGPVPVVLFYETSGKRLQLPEQNWLLKSPESIEALKKLLGNENVVFK